MYQEDNGRKAGKKLVSAFVFAILGVICILISNFYLEPRYEELQTSINSTAELAKKISAVEAEAISYEETLQASGKRFGNIGTDKEKYISYLGETTTANRLNINKMTVADATKIGSDLYSIGITLEVQGSLYNIKNLVQQLYDSDIVNRINTISYRLQSDAALQWMWRTIDDTQLVSWWDLQTKAQASSGEKEIITSAALMEHGTALCYLEIEFIGKGG